MSLAGKLEDLALGDIVQIISLSQKTGSLSLRSAEHDGMVIFRDGQVVYARCSCQPRFLGETLVEKEITDVSTLSRALLLQKQDGFKERLGPILIRSFGVNARDVEIVAREQIREVMRLLFTWHEGSFEFDLRDDVVTSDDASVDPLQFMLEQGLNPQLLTADEEAGEEHVSSHQDTAVGSTAFPLPASTIQQRHAVVIVDDDATILDSLVHALNDHGWLIEAFTGGEDALVSIERLNHLGHPTTVVVDLIMPRMDGTGILGGLELIELIKGKFPDLPVIAIADYHNVEAERKARNLGCAFLLKPRKGDFGGTEAGTDFSTSLVSEIDRHCASEEPWRDEQRINIGAELLRELGVEAPVPRTCPESTGISLLRSMLAELNNPALGGGIVLLVLRFAAEFMSRALVFSVRDNHIAGLGQFGISHSNPDDLVRSLCVPCDEPSLFTMVLQKQLPGKFHPEDSAWDEYLFEKIGGKPREAFIGPIVSGGNVVAILYGDNAAEGKPIGDTDSLEIFLSQAGIAMEKALLERTLQEMKVVAP